LNQIESKVQVMMERKL